MLRSSGSTLSPSPSPHGSILSSQSLTRACGSGKGVEYRSPGGLRALPSGLFYCKLCLVQCLPDCSSSSNPPTVAPFMLPFIQPVQGRGILDKPETSKWSVGGSSPTKKPPEFYRLCFLHSCDFYMMKITK